MLVDTDVCVRMVFRVGGNLSARGKPTYLTWWPHDHPTCQCWVSSPGCSGERQEALRQPDSHNSNEFTSVQSMFSYNKYLQGLLYILFQGRVLYSNINCTWLFKPSCMITGFLWKEVMLQYWYRQTRSCGIPTNIKF